MQRDKRVLLSRVTVLGFMLMAAAMVWLPELYRETAGQDICDPNILCVAFLNVGQGDAIFIQSPAGTQLLIDGGRGSDVLRELSEVLGFFDRDIDYVLATHPDADHIGGLMEVFTRYRVENFIRTANEADTEMWRAVENLSEAEGSAIYYARRGQEYNLGGGVVLEILFPDVDTVGMESNKASIVARLIYGETEFMLTGDSPKSIEEYLVLVEGEHLKSEVLKVGHHGSRTSTAELFLAEVSPDYAVISAGADNPYGHPHTEVTDMLFNYGMETFVTAEDGRIVFWSDGQSVQVK